MEYILLYSLQFHYQFFVLFVHLSLQLSVLHDIPDLLPFRMHSHILFAAPFSLNSVTAISLSTNTSTTPASFNSLIASFAFTNGIGQISPIAFTSFS